MSRVNPLYSVHSAVLKLEGHSKALMIKPWFNSINAYSASLIRDLYPVDGAMIFLHHVNNDVYQLFMQNQEFIPLPVPPVMPADPDALAFNIYKMRKEEYSKISSAFDAILKEIIASLDDEIYTVLTNLGGLRGIYFHSAANIVSYVVNNYGLIDKDMISRQRDMIQKPFDHNLELVTNFSNMAAANLLLPDSRRFSDNELFSIAFDNCSRVDTRLSACAVKFRCQPGFNELEATFAEFKSFMVKENSLQIYDPATSSLAFKGDKDYKPRGVGPNHKLGLATISDLIDQSSDDLNVALAASNPGKMVSISEDDMKEYKRLKAKAAKAAKKAASKGVAHSIDSNELPFGRICFNCGWGDHNSRHCHTMMNAPKGTFTVNQMSLVVFSPSKDPHTIDGKAICQKVAAGYRARE